MANAVRNISYHVFNYHDNCGLWCGYVQDKENYDYKIIPGGFDDLQLFAALQDIYNKLGDNAEKYSAAASSNANESLNNTMASKARKSCCYSMSASADFRFSCTIGQKNIGEGYIQEIEKVKNLSPGKFLADHVQRVQEKTGKKRLFKNLLEAKRARIDRKKKRTALRHRKGDNEGVTYESNCALFGEPAVQLEEDYLQEEEEEEDDDNCIVLIDLETSSFNMNCDILQIAAKYKNNYFSRYINPVQSIAQSATDVHGLTNSYGELMLNGMKISSVHIRTALNDIKEWLTSIGKKCYITVHNLTFDGPRLWRSICKYSLLKEFSQVIYGFIDTLPVIRSVTGRKAKNESSLTGLAHSLNISTAGAHNAKDDCKILQKLHISKKVLLDNFKTFNNRIDAWEANKKRSIILGGLIPLKNVGLSIRKQLADADISIEILKDIFQGLMELKNYSTIK
ncbi:uncharacterized protein [Chelonus insularis]|uniref:uncharacterized protein n=1 Tax=Chelonus insularis TaxID=460826 RepID=UPI00158D2646|nr:uncharacterized protein LOC118071033 [Chelonus insularis]